MQLLNRKHSDSLFDKLKTNNDDVIIIATVGKRTEKPIGIVSTFFAPDN